MNMTFPSPISTNQTSSNGPSPSSEILSNLRHVFLSAFDPKNLVTNSVAETTDTLSAARKTLLAKLPRMISFCVKLWMSVEQARLKQFPKV
jgi:hypothetical protein